MAHTVTTTVRRVEATSLLLYHLPVSWLEQSNSTYSYSWCFILVFGAKKANQPATSSMSYFYHQYCITIICVITIRSRTDPRNLDLLQFSPKWRRIVCIAVLSRRLWPSKIFTKIRRTILKLAVGKKLCALSSLERRRCKIDSTSNVWKRKNSAE